MTWASGTRLCVHQLVCPAGTAPQVRGPWARLHFSTGGGDWSAQRAWLREPILMNLLVRPAKLGYLPARFVLTVYRFMADINTMQWSAYRAEALQGVLACQHAMAARLSLGGPCRSTRPDASAPAVIRRRMLTKFTRRDNGISRRAADEAIRAAGFSAQRTLVWMQAPGSNRFVDHAYMGVYE